MYITKTRTRILLLAVAAGTLAVGASSSALASTEPPEPAPVGTAGEPSSPEAAAFCEAYLAVEAAAGSEDPAAIEPAIAAATETATPEVLPLFEAVVASFMETGGGGPEFDAVYADLIAWMQENCGFSQLDVTLTEYEFGGIPAEVPAGPAIVSALNTGEEVHEIVVFRINDDVTMSLEELFMMPEEELFANLTFAGAGFAVPDVVGNAVLNLTPGRHVAICFLPTGLTAEIFAEAGGAIGPDVSFPPDAGLGAPHFTEGMIQEFSVS